MKKYYEEIGTYVKSMKEYVTCREIRALIPMDQIIVSSRSENSESL